MFNANGRHRAIAVLGSLVLAAGLAAARSYAEPVAPAVASAADSIPFRVGELVTYDVRFGPVRVGHASMQVMGIEDVRGRSAWHTSFHVEGAALFFQVNDLMESWFDSSFSSLRFHRELHEGTRDRVNRYEIYPERGVFIDEADSAKTERPTVANPLDDGSFIYFARTLPLEVGRSFTFPRYFIPDRNPVTLEVVRREEIEVPAGKFDALVVRPTIKARGIFGEDGRAELWFSNDSRRLLLQMRTKLSFGTLSLHMRQHKP